MLIFRRADSEDLKLPNLKAATHDMQEPNTVASYFVLQEYNVEQYQNLVHYLISMNFSHGLQLIGSI